MGSKGKTTTLEERVLIGEMAKAGRNSREIALELGQPLATVRKWRQKYAREGRDGLLSLMGRPAAGALATAPAEMRDVILEMREKTSWLGSANAPAGNCQGYSFYRLVHTEQTTNCSVPERTTENSQV